MTHLRAYSQRVSSQPQKYKNNTRPGASNRSSSINRRKSARQNEEKRLRSLIYYPKKIWRSQMNWWWLRVQRWRTGWINHTQRNRPCPSNIRPSPNLNASQNVSNALKGSTLTPLLRLTQWSSWVKIVNHRISWISRSQTYPMSDQCWLNSKESREHWRSTKFWANRWTRRQAKNLNTKIKSLALCWEFTHATQSSQITTQRSWQILCINLGATQFKSLEWHLTAKGWYVLTTIELCIFMTLQPIKLKNWKWSTNPRSWLWSQEVT